MNPTDNPIYANVQNALQDADELGGVKDTAEYIALMEAIHLSIVERLKNARELAGETTADRFFKWLDAQRLAAVPVMDALKAALIASGAPNAADSINVRHTGGGCLAFEVMAYGRDGDPLTGYWLIGDSDGGRLPTAADEPCSLGLYSGEDYELAANFGCRNLTHAGIIIASYIN